MNKALTYYTNTLSGITLEELLKDDQPLAIQIIKNFNKK